MSDLPDDWKISFVGTTIAKLLTGFVYATGALLAYKLWGL